MNEQTHCQECGALQPDISKPKRKRSNPQHSRFFVMISWAFDHWPEQYEEFQPANKDELRAYLTMKAGWRDVTQIATMGVHPEKVKALCAMAIQACGAFAMPEFYKGSVLVTKPKSIAFERMSQADFCKLNDRVAIEIEKIIGARFDDDGRHTTLAA